MIRALIFGTATLTLSTGVASAQAVYVTPGYPAPAYVAPAPAYVAPAPVYVAPAPVYTAPAIVSGYAAPPVVASSPVYDYAPGYTTTTIISRPGW